MYTDKIDQRTIEKSPFLKALNGGENFCYYDI